MPLMRVKQILLSQPRASLYELSQRCDIPPEQMQDIVNLWVNKRKVRPVKPVGCGRTCHKCHEAWLQEYEWCENEEECPLMHNCPNTSPLN